VTVVVLLLIVSVIVGGAVLLKSGLRTGASRGAPTSKGDVRPCPECGELNPTKARFCGQCGAKAP
jgi:hypothetical protein